MGSKSFERTQLAYPVKICRKSRKQSLRNTYVAMHAHTIQDEILVRSKLWRLAIFSVIHQYLIHQT